jgi:hypothetical protein
MFDNCDERKILVFFKVKALASVNWKTLGLNIELDTHTPFAKWRMPFFFKVRGQ